MMHRFKELDIWKLSREFCSEVYAITATFPETEKFGITSQLRRASVSVPSNIAEGCSRNSNKDFSRFLEITIGSLYELETQLLISNDLGFVSEKKTQELIQKLTAIVKMTSKLKSSLK